METNINTNDPLSTLTQEFNNQDFYGLQYVLEDLFNDKNNKTEQQTLIDWCGLSDLII